MFHVLSFNQGRIEILSNAEGRVIVRKKTSEKEYQNLVLAQQHLLKHRPTLVCRKWQQVSISVAEVSEWNQEAKLLSTFFCHGDNLEEILRKSFGSAREDWIDFLRKIFELFKSNGFLWGDFAPRNMIWDQTKKIIWLVDFERMLHLKDCPIEHGIFNRYVRDYSREEFSCFLNPLEQRILFKGFLEEDYPGHVPISQIASKRKKALLKNTFGEKESYPLSELREVEDIMVFVATPFQVHGILFFPMDSLDRIGNKGGPDEYTKAVMEIKNLGEHKRYVELKRRTKDI